MSVELRQVKWAADTMLLELRQSQQLGIGIRILHRFHLAGTECHAGEEVWAAYLLVGGREIPLRLSLALLLLLDYLARTRHVPQSATQIAAGLRISRFYRQHAANSGIIARRKFARSSIKEYIMRIRAALAIASRERGIYLDPKRFVTSKETIGNQTLYQLRASVEIVHV